MNERDLGRYQMLWDCPACDTQKLLGLTHRHCPNCGSAQDPSRRYFPLDADKVTVEDHPYTGTDKICPACDSPSAAIAHNCGNCGSALDGAAAVRQRATQAEDGGGFRPDDAKAARAERDTERRGLTPQAPPAEAPRGSGTMRVVLLVLAAIVVGVIVFLTWKKDVGVEVTGHSWVRSIAVEVQSLVTETAWRDSVPLGAAQLSCSQAQRSTKQVPDGQQCHKERRDLGDGTFKEVEVCKAKYRSEPVYDERCTFVVPRWVHARDATTSGRGLQDTPRWPEPRLARAGACIGCEREGAREQKYIVELVERPSGKTQTCELPEARWASLAVGSRWAAKARMIGGGLDCDSLAPAR